MKMGKLIADAWRFAAKRKKLLENPEKEMIDAGINIPHLDQVRIVALEDTKTTIHLILPVRPSELSVADMGTDAFHLDLGRKLFAACR
jgi:hypothetical protein